MSRPSIPLALALRDVRVTPDGREVRCEREDALALVCVDGEPLERALTLILLSGRAQGAQLAIPIGLERVGNEAIRGSHLHVAMPRLVGLVETGADLLLDGERQLLGHRRHRLDEQLADSGIALGADDALI